MHYREYFGSEAEQSVHVAENQSSDVKRRSHLKRFCISLACGMFAFSTNTPVSASDTHGPRTTTGISKGFLNSEATNEIPRIIQKVEQNLIDGQNYRQLSEKQFDDFYQQLIALKKDAANFRNHAFDATEKDRVITELGILDINISSLRFPNKKFNIADKMKEWSQETTTPREWKTSDGFGNNSNSESFKNVVYPPNNSHKSSAHPAKKVSSPTKNP